MIVKDDKDVHFVSTRYKEIKNKGNYIQSYIKLICLYVIFFLTLHHTKVIV